MIRLTIFLLALSGGEFNTEISLESIKCHARDMRLQEMSLESLPSLVLMIQDCDLTTVVGHSTAFIAFDPLGSQTQRYYCKCIYVFDQNPSCIF